MPQEDGDATIPRAPRTRIEDLPQPVEALTEEEASLASGGLITVRGTWETVSTNQANTCTVGNALSGSDTDYGRD
jgi:hypothetical protein